jgi:hypothetical protein
MATPSIYSADSCYECELQAAGRCPTCRHGLCMDHFPLEAHEPCATQLATEEPQRVCYVCGVSVGPRQWSTTTFTHYIDSQKCAGCGRYICDARHTRLRTETVKVAREGLRNNRYHVTVRYCDICAPIRGLGGLVGATWWLVGLTTAGAAAFFLFHP